MLAAETCTACRSDAVPASAEECATLLIALNESVDEKWSLVQKDGIRQLQKTYRFDDFASALAFTVCVGLSAERMEHHPVVETTWGSVTVRWWTHTIRAVHRNDFIAAAHTDVAYNTMTKGKNR